MSVYSLKNRFGYSRRKELITAEQALAGGNGYDSGGKKTQWLKESLL